MQNKNNDCQSNWKRKSIYSSGTVKMTKEIKRENEKEKKRKSEKREKKGSEKGTMKDDEKISYDGREFSSIFLARRDELLSVNALLCLHIFTRCFIYYFQSVEYTFPCSVKR